eukprot:10302365-Karenia_brevis.AAC.1
MLGDFAQPRLPVGIETVSHPRPSGSEDLHLQAPRMHSMVSQEGLAEILQRCASLPQGFTPRRCCWKA